MQDEKDRFQGFEEARVQVEKKISPFSRNDGMKVRLKHFKLRAIRGVDLKFDIQDSKYNLVDKESKNIYF